jgi:hypothetical protein
MLPYQNFKTDSTEWMHPDEEEGATRRSNKALPLAATDLKKKKDRSEHFTIDKEIFHEVTRKSV